MIFPSIALDPFHVLMLLEVQAAAKQDGQHPGLNLRL